MMKRAIHKFDYNNKFKYQCLLVWSSSELSFGHLLLDLRIAKTRDCSLKIIYIEYKDKLIGSFSVKLRKIAQTNHLTYIWPSPKTNYSPLTSLTGKK